MIEVLEHLADPYRFFYSLFAKGAIARKTTVIIATPNARSAAAIADPAGWTNGCPPSDVTGFSGQSLTHLLETLRFQSIRMRGVNETHRQGFGSFEDELEP